MSISAIVILAVFIVSLPVCFLRPFYGVIVWSIIAFVNPQWYAWGMTRSVPWAVLVGVATLSGMVCFARGWRQLATRECFLLLVLWVWFTLTSIVSAHTPLFASHADDTWARWAFVSKILLMTGATVVIVNSLERVRALLITIGMCFGIFVFRAVPFMIRTGGAFRLYGPENSMIADNNDFGLALNMTLPIFFFLAQTEERRWLKRVFQFLFVSIIPAIFFTYSRGALVGLTAILILMFFQLKQRALLVPVVVMGVTIAVLFAPAAWRDRMDPTKEGAIDGSARSRLNAWTYSWRLASDYPVTGGGFETFTQDLFNRYAPNSVDLHGPHSIYFGVLAEHGFVGLGLYLGLLASCIFTTRAVLREARAHNDRKPASYALMLRFSLVGFATSGAFLGRAYFDYFFLIVALISVLKSTTQNRWQELADDGSESEELTHDLSEVHG